MYHGKGYDGHWPPAYDATLFFLTACQLSRGGAIRVSASINSVTTGCGRMSMNDTDES